MKKMYTVVDLFSGAGGLSLGFQQTKKYDIKVAFENNPNMQETYKLNHPDVDVRGDVCVANFKQIRKQYGQIDVVIGGPPCQGFSNANRQKNHVISQNNMLVKQYIRAIKELQPMAFVMENVSMLRSEVHRFYLDESDVELMKKYDIPMTPTKLVLIDKQFMFDGALEVVRDQEKIIKYLWHENDYVALNVIYKAIKNPQKLIKALTKYKKHILQMLGSHDGKDNSDYIYHKESIAFDALAKYYKGKYRAEQLEKVITPVIMIQRMLSKALEIFQNHLVVDEYLIEGDLCAIIRSYAVFDYLKSILGAEPNNYAITADVLNAADFGAPQKRMRFVTIGIKKSIVDLPKLPHGTYTEDKYRTVRDAISDLEEIIPVFDVAADTGMKLAPIDRMNPLGRELRDTKYLYNHIVTNTRDTAMERFRALKPGQNFHSLDDSLKINTYTDVSRTQNTIYLRLNYDEPSGTVVNVRKSMWVHPTLDRAISIREAARLQTFPDSFVFCGTKDKQYQQVGNAVPPILAKAIAKCLDSQLKKNL